MATSSQRPIQIATSVGVLAIGGFVVTALVNFLGPRFDTAQWEAPAHADTPVTTPEPDSPAAGFDLVADTAGYRPRAGLEAPARTTALGLWRTEELAGRTVTGPRILWIGDELALDGSAESAPAQLERALRQAEGFEGTVVLDASCPGYSLYQLALRARGLKDTVRPHLIVYVVQAGNDLVELVDEGRPHIDRHGIERIRPNPEPPPTLRAQLAGRLGPLPRAAFSATFYQASWLLSQAARDDNSLDVRIRVALRACAIAGECPVLFVVVPPWELVSGISVLEASTDTPTDYAKLVAEHDGQTKLFALLLGYLENSALRLLDLGPSLIAVGTSAWTPDLRLSRQSHGLLAKQALPIVRSLLDAYY